MQENKIKIADIAIAAGVSTSTVSNVLTGKRQMNTENGQRILQIASQMGYQQKKRRTYRLRTIICSCSGVFVMESPFFSELLTGIDEACKKYNYELIISYLQITDHCSQQISNLLRDPVDGILLIATAMSPSQLRLFLISSTPLVVIDAMFPYINVNAIGINNEDAGYKAVHVLVKNGHKKIGFVGSSFSFRNMTDRETGWRNGMAAYRLVVNERNIIRVEPTMEGAFRDMYAHIKNRRDSLPTAFFAANDLIAVSVCRALKTHGYHLPEDVSIIGMDDMPICQMVHPKLSTIAVPKHQLGITAVERLYKMMEEEPKMIIQSTIGVHVVQRESVKTIF